MVGAWFALVGGAGWAGLISLKFGNALFRVGDQPVGWAQLLLVVGVLTMLVGGAISPPKGVKT